MTSSTNPDFNAAVGQTLPLERFYKEVREFYLSEFRNEQAFATIYGSHVYGTAKADSDVDIMFVADDANAARMERCIDFVISLHERNNLPLDNDLRYEHKVLIPLDFMQKAVSGAGFKKADGSYYIPKIEKTRECLDSEPLRFRFLNGVMAHQQLFVAGSYNLYTSLHDRAVDTLFTAITAARGCEIVSPEIMRTLLMSNGEDTEDYYLGFKNTPSQNVHLLRLCSETLARMASEHKAPAVQGEYDFFVTPRPERKSEITETIN